MAPAATKNTTTTTKPTATRSSTRISRQTPASTRGESQAPPPGTDESGEGEEQARSPRSRVGRNSEGEEASERGDTSTPVQSQRRPAAVPMVGNGSNVAGPIGPENASRSAAVRQVRSRSVDSNRRPVRDDALDEAWAARMGRSSMSRNPAKTNTESPPPDAGPSGRGKAVDPRNWGAAGIPEDESDPEVQHALLAGIRESAAVQGDRNMRYTPVDTRDNRAPNGTRKTTDETPQITREEVRAMQEKAKALEKEYRRQKKEAKAAEEHAPRRTASPLSNEMEALIGQATRRPTAIAGGRKATSGGRNEMRSDGGREMQREPLPVGQTPSRVRNSRPEVLRASNQVAPDSYLSWALNGNKKHPPEQPTRGAADGQDEEEDSSSEDDEDPSDSDPSDSEDEEDHKKKKKRTVYKQIAPTTPEKYSGEADPMKFYRFATQCARFCREANIPKYDRISKCADYLTGKAYKFYTTEVSMDTEGWSMKKFMKGLFNYCFPPDFRLKQSRDRDTSASSSKQTNQNTKSRYNNNSSAPSSSSKPFKPYDNEKSRSDKGKESDKKKESKPELTEEEKTLLRKQGKCFHCREKGHISRQCPKAQTVASSKGSKPPGVKSFSVELAVQKEKQYRNLEGTTEPAKSVGASSVMLANVSFDTGSDTERSEVFQDFANFMSGAVNENDSWMCESDFEEAPEEYVEVGPTLSYEEAARLLYDPESEDTPKNVDGKIGDPLCEQVEHLLDAMRPYPGDPCWEGKDEVTNETEVLEASMALRDDFLIGRCAIGDEYNSGGVDKPSS
ncbi:hypothetical protein NLJ89_g6638 [Agrocybe chaxingu]|uniref:CCHC-type domain-containing protein n=1 Tax=Agrocybe chaxingu TaxID=84603 RepID=A0A9W8MUG0_9AGAR|nr:hypothetical protein NLJ89_g6638 [Agrocybe chaxingu]